MPSVFFDIQLGASGDMLIGALIDAGLDHDALKIELKKIHLHDWDINPARIKRGGFAGTCAHVTAGHEHHHHDHNNHDHGHGHHHHEHRSLSLITGLIESSALSNAVKKDILSVFRRIAEAEARVHGTGIEEVHFHEVGAVDSIIDISAFCIARELMGIGSIYFNEFCFGGGTVYTAHGEIPVPVPAVVELSKGFASRSTDRRGELITPTAAAILTALGSQDIGSLRFTVTATGIGFGTREHALPSYTRALLIDEDQAPASSDAIVELVCNIDDMNPQIYPYLLDLLLANHALDAYITPVVMKKGRSGSLLTVLAEKLHSEQLKNLIYSETTTLGMRIRSVQREKLERSFETVAINGHQIRIKLGTNAGKIVSVQPEFEDCKQTALSTGKPLKDIMDSAKVEYRTKNADNGR